MRERLEQELASVKAALANVTARLTAVEQAGGRPASPVAAPAASAPVKRFALIGPLDPFHTGRDDWAELKRLISAAGGNVDYDLPPPGEGKESGRLTGEVGFYVYDDRLPFAVDVDQKQSGAIKEAREMGIRPMRASELLVLLADSRHPLPPIAEDPLPLRVRLAHAMHPKTREILETLEQPVPMSFPNETPLKELLRYIKATTRGPDGADIPIYVDPVGLNEAEKTMTSPVTLDVVGVPLKTTLRLALKQLGLTYIVKDGLLTIVSEASEDISRSLDEIVDRARGGELSLAEIRGLTEWLQAVGELEKSSQSVSAGQCCER